MSHTNFPASSVSRLNQLPDTDIAWFNLVGAAVRVLEKRGVDLLLSNQSHPAWGRGLKMAGFLEGPSNFLLITSQQLTRLLDEDDPSGVGIHLNRGDGDGPIHL